MLKSFKKTIYVFLIILLLPTIGFSVYKIGNLRTNEEVIESIYENQLDAILFSINQYSNDVISSWAGKLELMQYNPNKDKQEILNRFIEKLPLPVHLIQFDSAYIPVNFAPLHWDVSLYQKEIIPVLHGNDSLIQRLPPFIKKGYRKVEPFGLNKFPEEILVFATQSGNMILLNCLIIDPVPFINKVLDPRIQEIAREKFDICAFDASTKSVTYSSNKNHIKSSLQHKKPFWLFKDFHLGIELKDRTIRDLSKARSKKDILLILMVDIALLFGVWLIYRNVKKQVELSQLKSDFVSNVSHEIRTPLALICMYIETLEMGRIKSTDKIKEYYSIILQETRRLSGIVNKILNFSQLDNDKRQFNFSNICINRIAENAFTTYRVILHKKGFEYKLDCSDNLPDILADKEAIADALMNLMDNAIKYSAERKKIEVSTGFLKEMIFVKVMDEGIGISEKDQKYIFNKFYRVTERNLAHKAKGSGLGLTIVKHIMDAHEGKIIVHSQKGKGSSFILLFPALKS